jgi:hypothetical protein
MDVQQFLANEIDASGAKLCIAAVVSCQLSQKVSALLSLEASARQLHVEATADVAENIFGQIANCGQIVSLVIMFCTFNFLKYFGAFLKLQIFVIYFRVTFPLSQSGFQKPTKTP